MLRCIMVPIINIEKAMSTVFCCNAIYFFKRENNHYFHSGYLAHLGFLPGISEIDDATQYGNCRG
jgi:hypothetical protein